VAKELHGTAAGKRRRERTPEPTEAEAGVEGDGRDDGGDGGEDEKAPHFSGVDRSRLELFPLFKRAATVEVTLGAGDVYALPFPLPQPFHAQPRRRSHTEWSVSLVSQAVPAGRMVPRGAPREQRLEREREGGREGERGRAIVSSTRGLVPVEGCFSMLSAHRPETDAA
jgi:hypothetical protein